MFGSYFLLALALVTVASRIDNFNAKAIFGRNAKKRLS
jgi:hypothetical protein